MTIKELLENPLIVKYFVCQCAYGESAKHHRCTEVMAYRILSAMCEPISEGEKYVNSSDAGIWMEGTFDKDVNAPLNAFHPFMLKLPDAFQEKKCACKFCCDCACKCHEKPDRIEVKFAELKEFIRCSDLRKDYAQIEFDRRVNELNALARKTKGGN